MPCCQRCTGLYAGALAAMVLHAWIRPRASRFFLTVHGFFLLQMIPCGLYWVPQSPVIRTVSGILGGFGIVAFLWVAPGLLLLKTRNNRWGEVWTYSCGLALTAAVVPWVAMSTKSMGIMLSWVVFVGALSLAALTLANVKACWKTVAWAFRIPRSRPSLKPLLNRPDVLDPKLSINQSSWFR